MADGKKKDTKKFKSTNKEVEIDSQDVELTARNILNGAWNLFVDKLGAILIVILVPSVVWMILTFIAIGAGALLFGDNQNSDPNAVVIGVGLAFFLTLSILFVWSSVRLSGGLLIATSKYVSEDKNFTIEDVWSSSKGLVWRLLGLSIVYGLLVLVGFILFIIPGIYWLIKYSPVVVHGLLHKDLPVKEVFNISGKMTYGYKGQLLLLDFVLIVLSLILGWIPFIGFIISFILQGVWTMALPYFYGVRINKDDFKGIASGNEVLPAGS